MPWPSKNPADYSPAPPRKPDTRPPMPLGRAMLLAFGVFAVCIAPLISSAIADEHPALNWAIVGALVAPAVVIGVIGVRRDRARSSDAIRPDYGDPTRTPPR